MSWRARSTPSSDDPGSVDRRWRHRPARRVHLRRARRLGGPSPAASTRTFAMLTTRPWVFLYGWGLLLVHPDRRDGRRGGDLRPLHDRADPMWLFRTGSIATMTLLGADDHQLPWRLAAGSNTQTCADAAEASWAIAVLCRGRCCCWLGRSQLSIASGARL